MTPKTVTRLLVEIDRRIDAGEPRDEGALLADDFSRDVVQAALADGLVWRRSPWTDLGITPTGRLRLDAMAGHNQNTEGSSR